MVLRVSGFFPQNNILQIVKFKHEITPTVDVSEKETSDIRSVSFINETNAELCLYLINHSTTNYTKIKQNGRTNC